VVERQTVNQWSQAKPIGRLRNRGQENRLLGRNAQMRSVMLSEMVASEAPTLGHLNEFKPLSVKLLQRYSGDSFEMIENPKLYWH
jgi:hypothetical protein